MTNPAHAAAIAYCLEHELPTTAGDAGEEGPENNPSTEVYLYMQGWFAARSHIAKWLMRKGYHELAAELILEGKAK